MKEFFTSVMENWNWRWNRLKWNLHWPMEREMELNHHQRTNPIIEISWYISECSTHLHFHRWVLFSCKVQCCFHSFQLHQPTILPSALPIVCRIISAKTFLVLPSPLTFCKEIKTKWIGLLSPRQETKKTYLVNQYI